MVNKFLIATIMMSLLTLAPVAVTATPTPKPAAAPVPPEPHPHIRAALRELQEARRELETASHDFGGHRKEAIEAVDNAIRQLQAALQSDKK